MTEQRRFCCGALIVKEGLFLFGKRAEDESTYAGLWDIIGGHNEGAETPEQTLTRELMEELGIVPTEYSLFHEVIVNDQSNLPDYQFYIYLVTRWAGEIVNCCEEHSEIRWFTREELDTLNLSSSNYKTLFEMWEKANLPG